MHSISIMRRLPFFLIILLLSGCARFNSGYQDNFPSHTDPYAESGLSELLAFGTSMTNMSEASRAELCRSLLNTQKISPSYGVQLHLMVGRLLSDACGDIPKLLNGINAINPAYVSDEDLRRFIALNSNVLMRLQAQQARPNRTAEHRQQKIKSVPNTKDTNETTNDETRLLREKLEAIRSMEKHMDESNSNNQ